MLWSKMILINILFCWTPLLFLVVWGVLRMVSYSACRDRAAFTTAILKATLNKKLLKLRNILSANCNITLQHDAGHEMNADGPDAPVE